MSTFTPSGDKVWLFAFHTKFRVIPIFWENDYSLHSLKTESTQTNDRSPFPLHLQLSKQKQTYTNSMKKINVCIIYNVQISGAESYLIHSDSSLHFPLFQIPHSADFVSARAGIKTQHHNLA